MPRKPKLNIHLVIEGLSDGRERRPAAFIDDFTGQPMPVVQDARPVKVLESAQAILDRRKAMIAADKRTLLERCELIKPVAKPTSIAPVVKGMRSIGQIAGHALYVPKPSWRRM